jgi:STE24 endopeptidase
MTDWSSSFWGVYVAIIILLPFVFDLVVEVLDLRYQAPPLPQELKDIYDESEAEKARHYHLDRLKPGLIHSSISLIATAAMITFAGFGTVDQWSKQLFPQQEIIASLAFIAIITLGSTVLSLPFKLYNTFVIEERYGFNRSTLKTFIVDNIKGLLLGLIIGGPVLTALIYVFDWGQQYTWAWAVAWGAMTFISVALLFLSPLLMGIFNKYEPLEDGPLKSAIEQLAETLSFEMNGIYKMDGSKRSSKANAFFAGFGSFRRIALFDTLIEKLEIEEINAVLAHEIGHCKHKHISKQFLFNSATMALSFFLVQELLMNRGLFEFFQMEPSTGLSLFLIFGFVLSPLHVITGLVSNILSRRYEFQADAFATQKAKGGSALISSLKKLSQDSLTKLQPHPLKAFIEHSHPTLIERTEHIKSL